MIKENRQRELPCFYRLRLGERIDRVTHTVLTPASCLPELFILDAHFCLPFYSYYSSAICVHQPRQLQPIPATW